jgi:hypothetical protein
MLAVLFSALLPVAASAQNWDVTGGVGVAIPMADISDTHDPGLHLSLSTTRWFGPRIGLRFGGAADLLGGANDFIEDATLWHYNVGPEFDFFHPREYKIKLHGNAGIGATTTQIDDESETDFTVNAGVNIEYPLNEYFRLIGGPAVYIIFADETQAVLPIRAGFRYLFSSN